MLRIVLLNREVQAPLLLLTVLLHLHLLVVANVLHGLFAALFHLFALLSLLLFLLGSDLFQDDCLSRVVDRPENVKAVRNDFRWLHLLLFHLHNFDLQLINLFIIESDSGLREDLEV